MIGNALDDAMQIGSASLPFRRAEPIGPFAAPHIARCAIRLSLSAW